MTASLGPMAGQGMLLAAPLGDKWRDALLSEYAGTAMLGRFHPGTAAAASCMCIPAGSGRCSHPLMAASRNREVPSSPVFRCAVGPVAAVRNGAGAFGEQNGASCTQLSWPCKLAGREITVARQSLSGGVSLAGAHHTIGVILDPSGLPPLISRLRREVRPLLQVTLWPAFLQHTRKLAPC